VHGDPLAPRLIHFDFAQIIVRLHKSGVLKRSLRVRCISCSSGSVGNLIAPDAKDTGSSPGCDVLILFIYSVYGHWTVLIDIVFSY